MIRTPCNYEDLRDVTPCATPPKCGSGSCNTSPKLQPRHSHHHSPLATRPAIQAIQSKPHLIKSMAASSKLIWDNYQRVASGIYATQVKQAELSMPGVDNNCIIMQATSPSRRPLLCSRTHRRHDVSTLTPLDITPQHRILKLTSQSYPNISQTLSSRNICGI